MSALSIPAARYPRGRLLRFVIDHNPFYLLSALCMLGGLLTLTNSLSYTPIPQRHLLLLIATRNCYELLLVALALWLIVRRRLICDGQLPKITTANRKRLGTALGDRIVPVAATRGGRQHDERTITRGRQADSP
jgi:hypothetical protein